MSMDDIKKSIYENNEIFNNTLKKIYLELNSNKFKFRTFAEFVEHWENLFINLFKNNLTIKEQFVFFLRCEFTNINSLSHDIKYVFHVLVRKYIHEYPNEILDILKDENIQILYSNWFKKCETQTDQNDDIYFKIFKLSKFKEIVLSDYNYIIDLFKYDFSIRIKYIPNDYNYLVGCINSVSLSKSELFKLYNKCFNKKIRKIDILNLINTHCLIDSNPNILNKDIKYIKSEYTNCLKDIYINPNYYKLLEKLKRKFNIDFKTIILFSSKYRNEKIFEDLFTIRYSSDISKKIKYLATSKKIININNINSLNDVTISNLISMKKEDNLKFKIYGGPNSTSKRSISALKNSKEREIRRINIDGSYVIKSLSDHISHFEGVRIIYNDNKIDKDLNTTIDISIEMIKNINSITLIIEKEICFIVMPTLVNEKQKNILINWLSSSNKKAEIGIIIYDKNTEKKEILTNTIMSIDEIITYISSLEEQCNKKR